MSEILIKTENLTKNYPDPSSVFFNRLLKRRAVDTVNLEIARGGTLAVVGESGCGKTTLGHMTVRLLPVTSGSIFFDGEDITKPAPGNNGAADKALRRRMQVVFQDPYGSLNPWMTISELIKEPLVIHKILPKQEMQDRVDSLLETVGMPKIELDRYPHQLSGGQRQRVAIARALAAGPEFLLCDEPVSSLDVSVQSQILNLLIDLRENLNLTYLFISHSLAVVKSIADRVAVMYLGRIVEQAPADAFFKEPAHPYGAALIAAAPEPVVGQKNRRPAVFGEASVTDAPENGCAYYPRCPARTEKCAESRPELTDIGGGRSVACFNI